MVIVYLVTYFFQESFTIIVNKIRDFSEKEIINGTIDAALICSTRILANIFA